MTVVGEEAELQPDLLADVATLTNSRRSTSSLIWILVLPVLVDQFLAMLVGWSDAFLVGKFLIEKPFLAAMVVGNYLLWFSECCGVLVSAGSQAVVARLVGAGEIDDANRITQQSIRLAAILGCVQTVLAFLLAPTVVGWMNLQDPAKSLAVDFSKIIAVSGPLMHILLVGVICLQAAGNTGVAMGLMLITNAINIAFSWALCVGFGPFPKWGWNGVATGTSISFAVGGILTLVCLKLGFADVRFPKRRPRWRLDDALRLLRIGVPGAANSLGVVLCQLWFLSIIGGLGNASLGAHGVATRCESLSYLAAEAFAVAAATLVGQSLGAREPKLARKAGWAAFRIGVVTMSLMGVVFYSFAPTMIGFFVDAREKEVFELGVPILRLVSLAMPALAACIILTGALRGAGDTRWPLAYSLFGLLLIRIPLAYLLTGPMKMGVYGAWVAMFIDLHVRGVCAIVRYHYGAWTQIKV